MHAALLIQTALNAGWEPDIDLYPDAADRDRIAAELRDIIVGLHRRSRGD